MAAQVDWDRLPDDATIEKTVAGMAKRNFNPILLPDRTAALEKLKQMIPVGSEVMTGSSTTLEEIDFVRYLKSGEHPWRYWKDRIVPERNAAKQLDLRRAATTAEYFLGSVQAITEAGAVLGADATGSRQGGYIYGAKNVIWVVGVNKIVKDLDMAIKRITEHCFPLEDERVKRTGGKGSFIGKLVIYEREGQPVRITTLVIKEKLGF